LPRWSISAIAVFVASPLLGIGSGLLDNALRSPEERDSGVFLGIYFVAWLGFLIGTVVASVGLSREEKPRWLRFLAFGLNATPVVLPGILLGINALTDW